MIYWIENIKDGSPVASAASLEEALAIQNKKLKEGIDTYIRKDSTEENEIKLVGELIEKLKEYDFFKDLDKKDLKHLDNIITGIVELKKLHNNSPISSPIWLWAMVMMLFFNNTSGNTFPWGVDINEELKEDKEYEVNKA